MSLSTAVHVSLTDLSEASCVSLPEPPVAVSSLSRESALATGAFKYIPYTIGLEPWQ